MKQELQLLITISCFLVFISTGNAQEKQSISVGSFDKITVSPHISLYLEEGDKEEITINNHEVPLEKINIEVKGKNLLIYLDDAKTTTKQVKRTVNGHSQSVPIYKGTQVSAHITYKTLNSLSIRGEEKITCISPLTADKLSFSLYGEATLLIDSIQTDELKAFLYGDNQITINKGNAASQIFKSYGDSKVDVKHLSNAYAKVTSYGSNTFSLNTSDKISVWAFGDAFINYTGNPEIKRLITIGEVNVKKVD